MKNFTIILLLFLSTICYGQQWQNKVDSIVIANRQLREYRQSNQNYKIRGYIVPFDANNNLSPGLNNVVTNGVNNYLGGDWITIVNGSGNMIHANHAHIANSNGGAFFGADHGTNTPCSGDFGFVANDANENHGASGSVFGFFNINYDENGFVFGDDNILGSIGSTKYSGILGGRNSRKIGNCGMTIGRRLDSNGDDIYLYGRGFSDTQRLIVTEAKSFNVGFNTTVPYFIVHPPDVAGVNAVGTTEMRGGVKNMPPEFSDNASAYAALGDSMYYRSWDGQKWQVCVTAEPPAFMIQEPQTESFFIKSITREQSTNMKGTWFNITGQTVTMPNTDGIYYFIESK